MWGGGRTLLQEDAETIQINPIRRNKSRKKMRNRKEDKRHEEKKRAKKKKRMKTEKKAMKRNLKQH